MQGDENERTKMRQSEDGKRGSEIKEVAYFVNLGPTVAKEGGGTEDIKKRLSKAQEAFLLTLSRPGKGGGSRKCPR